MVQKLVDLLIEYLCHLRKFFFLVLLRWDGWGGEVMGALVQFEATSKTTYATPDCILHTIEWWLICQLWCSATKYNGDDHRQHLWILGAGKRSARTPLHYKYILSLKHLGLKLDRS